VPVNIVVRDGQHDGFEANAFTKRIGSHSRARGM
jgi:hypothetical protein